MLYLDDEVTIPAEAIGYIEERVKSHSCKELLKFEVIELFFEWFSLQNRDVQKEVLKKAMFNGRPAAGFSTAYRRKVL